jgi:hypothetical protein
MPFFIEILSKKYKCANPLGMKISLVLVMCVS